MLYYRIISIKLQYLEEITIVIIALISLSLSLIISYKIHPF